MVSSDDNPEKLKTQKIAVLKKNGLQIISREEMRFDIHRMLFYCLSLICVSMFNSLIFNFTNKKRVWQEVYSKCCST